MRKEKEKRKKPSTKTLWRIGKKINKLSFPNEWSHILYLSSLCSIQNTISYTLHHPTIFYKNSPGTSQGNHKKPSLPTNKGSPPSSASSPRVPSEETKQELWDWPCWCLKCLQWRFRGWFYWELFCDWTRWAWFLVVIILLFFCDTSVFLIECCESTPLII